MLCLCSISKIETLGGEKIIQLQLLLVAWKLRMQVPKPLEMFYLIGLLLKFVFP